MDNELFENAGVEIYKLDTMADGARNTGYKSTYNAIAEIVDNSIESNAKNIFIIGTQDLIMNQQGIKAFAFLDDGDGMDDEVLKKCLQIGFSTRTARKGMGRFGVGLPQASSHVSPRVEVYSWKNGIENCKYVFLDWNEVSAGKQTKILPTKSEIPEQYKKFIDFRTPDKNYDFREHGTLVIWPECDRVDHKKWNTCKRYMSEDLGRKYRWMLDANEVEISTLEINNLNTFTKILPNDPLYLMNKSQACVKKDFSDSNSNCERYNEVDGYTETIFEPYIDEDNPTGVVEKEVYYFDKNNTKQTSIVTIRFSIIKKEHYDKQFIVRNPGDLPYGKVVDKNTGISIIRQNREVDFGSFDYFNITNNPYHRWWGCEISFNPELDEAFGISNNKQQVSLKKIDDDAISDYEDNEPMWLQLKSVISDTIKSMVKRNSELRKGTRTSDIDTNVSTAISQIIKTAETENPDIKVNIRNEETDIGEADIKDIIIKGLREEGRIDKDQEDISEAQIKQYLDSDTRIIYVDRGRGPLLDFESRLGILRIFINRDNLFYQDFISEAYSDENKNMQITFELFLVSLVKSMYKLNDIYAKAMDKLIDDINTRLKAYMKHESEL